MNKVQLNQVSHSVRSSQAALQYGVGAMVDFPDQVLMTAAPEKWENQIRRVNDERLEKALNVSYFGVPQNNYGYESYGISYVRFPEWYFCPKCRSFKPLKEWISEYGRKNRNEGEQDDPNMVKHMKCPVCSCPLVPTRIIVACSDGHIDDFPWIDWVHCRAQGGPKEICRRPKLTFKTGASSSEGLENLIIECQECGAKATLRDSFDPEIFRKLQEKYGTKYNFKCRGKHPWKQIKEECYKYPRTLQRGGSTVYFPITVSSLVIPPYSSKATQKIESSNAYKEAQKKLMEKLRGGTSQQTKEIIVAESINSCAEQISEEKNLNLDLVKNILRRKWISSGEPTKANSIKYREEEYEVLSGRVNIDNEENQCFKREDKDITKYELPYIKQIALIHQVREVQALVGFSRINPVDNMDLSGNSSKPVSVKEESTNWYPAYETKGEGIFIALDEEQINKWRTENEAIEERIKKMQRNYDDSFIGRSHPKKISSKYVLMHTLSHLLIKQLSFECGYNVASLKERIYCSEASDGLEMSGIFIYTANGDSEGTLGGLVRQGYEDTFPPIFKKAIISALSCSNDPVCSLSMGQGRDSSNLAACYSCALLPETSCESYNVFLDRGTIIGTYNNKDMGFYSKQAYGRELWKSSDAETKTEDYSKKIEPLGEILFEKNETNTEDYYQIWEDIFDYLDDDSSEYNLIAQILDNISQFDGKEHPYSRCDIRINGTTITGKVTLLWEKSKVIYLSGENTTNLQQNMISEEWKIFKGNDKETTYKNILDSIEEDT